MAAISRGGRGRDEACVDRLRRCLHIALYIVMSMAIAEGRLSAHSLGQSYVFFHIADESIGGRIEMTLADLNKALNLDLQADDAVNVELIEPHVDEIRAYLLVRIAMNSAEGPRPLHLGEHRILYTDVANYFVVDFELERFDERPSYLDIEFSVLFDVEPSHQNIVVVENHFRAGTINQEANIALIFNDRDVEQRLDLTSSSVWRGFWALVELGIHHIWIGIDHILFLLALLLPAALRRSDSSAGAWEPVASFRIAAIRVVKIVTLFTVAHSVTLSLAALNVVQLSSRLVESIIAISIAVAAVDIVVPLFKGRIWLVVFGFGLFHGFGFASVLATMGIPGSFMALSLFGFNLGVELGQVAVIALLFPPLYFLRRFRWYSFPVVQAAALGLIFVSLYWFTERAFEVDLPLGSIVWGLLGVD